MSFGYRALGGQSLTEYGIITALVAVVSIGVWVGLSGGLRAAVSGMASDNQGANKTPLTAVIASPQGQTSLTSGSPPSANDLSAGFDLTSPSASAGVNSIASLVETVGANGTTSILASQIEILAKQLLESGKIDQEQANILQNLSNKGHEIAMAQKGLEESAQKAGGDSQKFQNTPIVLNDGQEYSRPWAVAALMGKDQYGEQGKLIKEFDALLAKAQSSGSLSDSVAREIVMTVTTNIRAISQEMLDTTGTIMNGESPAALHQAIVEEAAGLKSTVTHSNSGVICTAGNGQDQGTACQ